MTSLGTLPGAAPGLEAPGEGAALALEVEDFEPP